MVIDGHQIADGTSERKSRRRLDLGHRNVSTTRPTRGRRGSCGNTIKLSIIRKIQLNFRARYNRDWRANGLLSRVRANLKTPCQWGDREWVDSKNRPVRSSAVRRQPVSITAGTTAGRYGTDGRARSSPRAFTAATVVATTAAKAAVAAAEAAAVASCRDGAGVRSCHDGKTTAAAATADVRTDERTGDPGNR